MNLGLNHAQIEFRRVMQSHMDVILRPYMDLGDTSILRPGRERRNPRLHRRSSAIYDFLVVLGDEFHQFILDNTEYDNFDELLWYPVKRDALGMVDWLRGKFRYNRELYNLPTWQDARDYINKVWYTYHFHPAA